MKTSDVRTEKDAMSLIEAKELDEILDIRLWTEGGLVEGASAGG